MYENKSSSGGKNKGTKKIITVQYMKTFGTRAEVMHGAAVKTTGGLEKSDLQYVDGRIVSKKACRAALRNPGLQKWRAAVNSAKKELGIPKTGEMALVKGMLLRKARNLFEKKK